MTIIYPTLVQPVPTEDQAQPRIDKFGQPLSLPPAFLAPRRLLTGAQQHFAFGPRYDFNPSSQIDWFWPLNEPPKPKASVLTAAQQYLAYQNVTAVFIPSSQIGWFWPLNEPPKPKASVRASAQQSFAYVKLIEAENVKLEWAPPLNEPPKPKRSILTAAQQHFQYQALVPVPDPTDPGKWWGDLARPGVHLVPRRLSTPNQKFEFFTRAVPLPEESNMARWFRQLEEPPKFKAPRRLETALQRHFSMTLHYPHIPTAYLEGYELTVELAGLDCRVTYLAGHSGNDDLLGQDRRSVYLIGYKSDSELG